MSQKKNVGEMSFEESLKELQEIVKQVESGQDSLEYIINQYERGNQLKKHCEKKLREAKLKIEKIVQQDNGSIQIEQADITE